MTPRTIVVVLALAASPLLGGADESTYPGIEAVGRTIHAKDRA